MRTNALVTVWNLSGGIVHVPPSGVVLVICGCPAKSILQSRRKCCEFRISHIVVRVSGVRMCQKVDPMGGKRTYSFQMVVQTSCRVTPRSFLTIVHHGEDSQITTNS